MINGAFPHIKRKIIWSRNGSSKCRNVLSLDNIWRKIGTLKRLFVMNVTIFSFNGWSFQAIILFCFCLLFLFLLCECEGGFLMVMGSFQLHLELLWKWIVGGSEIDPIPLNITYWAIQVIRERCEIVINRIDSSWKIGLLFAIRFHLSKIIFHRKTIVFIFSLKFWTRFAKQVCVWLSELALCISENKNQNIYKHCKVPQCESTTIRTPTVYLCA